MARPAACDSQAPASFAPSASSAVRSCAEYNRRVNATERTQWVTERAREVGFDLCGVAPAADFDELARLPGWLDRGYAGEMRYLHDSRRQSPAAAMPGARSIIVCALNYKTAHPYPTEAHVTPPLSRAHSRPRQTAAPAGLKPGATPDAKVSAPSAVRSPGPRGWISRYAWGDDYHHVLGEKLEVLVAAMRAEFREPFEARAYVDTGPVVERVTAKYAGLGWLGKNTCLINEHLGSWLFLGVILTTLDLQPSLYDEGGESVAPRSVGTGNQRSEVRPQTSEVRSPLTQHSPAATDFMWAPDLCGNCTQCIDACPTGAIVEPYVLDARRCISYLTIELRGTIPEDLRPAMGWQVFGCDICQDVCPFNRKAPTTNEERFMPRNVKVGRQKPEVRSHTSDAGSPNASRSPLATGQSSQNTATLSSLLAPDLLALASLTEDDFRRTFRGSAVKRTKWRGLVRNACIALGNCSGDLQVAARGVPTTAGLPAGTGDPARISARLEKLSRSADPVIADAARWALERVQTATTKS